MPRPTRTWRRLMGKPTLCSLVENAWREKQHQLSRGWRSSRTCKSRDIPQRKGLLGREDTSQSREPRNKNMTSEHEYNVRAKNPTSLIYDKPTWFIWLTIKCWESISACLKNAANRVQCPGPQPQPELQPQALGQIAHVGSFMHFLWQSCSKRSITFILNKTINNNKIIAFLH